MNATRRRGTRALLARLQAVALSTLPALTAWGHPPAVSTRGHGAVPSRAAELPWVFEPWVVALLACAGLLYAVGVARTRAKRGRLRGVELSSASCFAAGWLALALALVSPIDSGGGRAFWLHMIQHELLMVVAAPLLVMGRPLAAFARALSPVAAARRGLHAASRAWMSASNPIVAALLHAIAVWTWHAPRLFDAALADPALHAAQHASFLVSALLLWSSLLPVDRRRIRAGLATFSLFATMMQTGALGVLLAVSTSPWYRSYAALPGVGGIDALDDQVLGGLIMWIPGGVVYLLAALIVVYPVLVPDSTRRAATAVRASASAQ